MNSQDMIGQVVAREMIRDRMSRYSRGIDRCDAELLRTVFWPEATVECADGYSGSASGLIDWAVPSLSQLDQTMHLLGNIFIELEGDRAFVETYAQCFHRIPDPSNGAKDVVIALRYVDLFERRGEEWRIIERVMLFDWFREYEDSGDMARGAMGMAFTPGQTMGGRWPDDRSYALLKKHREASANPTAA